ncbi:MAG: SDR family oxidoreductase, partial [Mesorhizobium sp.]
ANVAFIDIADGPSTALADRIEKAFGKRPLYLKTDLRDVEALRASAAKAAEAHGDVTVLVNNAAWDERHAVEDVTVEFWDNNQAINLRPHFFTAQAVAPGMKRILGLTKGLAGKLGVDGIRVNAIAPGWVITERQKELWVTEQGLAAHVAKQCIKQVMQPDDIVGTVLFLASDASRMLTAQMLIVDGGFL